MAERKVQIWWRDKKGTNHVTRISHADLATFKAEKKAEGAYPGFFYQAELGSLNKRKNF